MNFTGGIYKKDTSLSKKEEKMGLNNLTAYLKKFTTVVSRKKVIRERFIESVKSVIGFPLKKEHVDIQRDTIWLKNVSSTLVHEIRRHEAEILSHVNSNMHGFVVKRVG